MMLHIFSFFLIWNNPCVFHKLHSALSTYLRTYLPIYLPTYSNWLSRWWMAIVRTGELNENEIKKSVFFNIVINLFRIKFCAIIRFESVFVVGFTFVFIVACRGLWCCYMNIVGLGCMYLLHSYQDVYSENANTHRFVRQVKGITKCFSYFSSSIVKWKNRSHLWSLCNKRRRKRAALKLSHV